MIRLFRHQARMLLMLLIAHRQRVASRNPDNATLGGPVSPEGATVNLVQAWMGANPAHPITAYLESISLHDAMIGDGSPIEEAMDDLSIQTAAADLGGSQRGDRTIIDTIVEVLQIPWTGNRVSGELLSALRKAIMRPSEVEAFKKVAKEAFACYSCGHRFVSNEAVVVRQVAGGPYAVACLLCASPDYGVCPSCMEPAVLNSSFRTALQSSKAVSCDCKSRKKVPKTMEMGNGSSITVAFDPPSAPPMTLREATLRERERLRGRAVTRAVPPPPPNFRSRIFDEGGPVPTPPNPAGVVNANDLWREMQTRAQLDAMQANPGLVNQLISPDLDDDADAGVDR